MVYDGTILQCHRKVLLVWFSFVRHISREVLVYATQCRTTAAAGRTYTAFCIDNLSAFKSHGHFPRRLVLFNIILFMWHNVFFLFFFRMLWTTVKSIIFIYGNILCAKIVISITIIIIKCKCTIFFFFFRRRLCLLLFVIDLPTQLYRRVDIYYVFWYLIYKLYRVY